MPDNKALNAPVANAGQGEAVDVDKFLSENPTIAEALRTFAIAEEHYRRSLQALTSVRVATAHDANVC